MRTGRESLVIENEQFCTFCTIRGKLFTKKKPLGFKINPAVRFTLLSQELSIVRRLLDIPFNQQ